MVFPGYHVRKDGTKLMEFIELPELKFFHATQAHPEFKSNIHTPSPLFFNFVKASIK
jgi:CTP synthase